MSKKVKKTIQSTKSTKKPPVKSRSKHTPPRFTAKQEKFCQEYMIDLNATQAAIRAGYSKKTAKRTGPENLSKPHISERIAKEKGKLRVKAGITAEMVIDELAKVGFSNIQDYIFEGNVIGDISTVVREKAAAVEAVQVDIRHDGGESKGYTEKVKLKLHSKLNALESLGRHLGIFEADNLQKPIVERGRLTEEELEKRLKQIKEAGNGIDMKSVEGGNGNG